MRNFLIISLAMFLAACASPVAIIQPTSTPISSTETMLPTETRSPTAVPSETFTPTPDPALVKVTSDFEKYGWDVAQYDVIIVEENVRVLDHETQKVIYENGRFELHYVVKMLAASDDLEATGYTPVTDGTKWKNRPTQKTLREYTVPLTKEAYGDNPFKNGKQSYTPFLIDPEINAWGVVRDKDVDDPNYGHELFYRNQEGKIVKIPLMPIDQIAVMWYYMEEK